jgi:filamentous hemagglutinin
VTKRTIVGYQGSGLGSPIYEYIYNGNVYSTAITIRDNGYIVGANMR